MDNLNHTFRVVWNQSLQVWQAVAETACSRGKTKSSKSARRAVVAAAALAAAASGLLSSGLAQAADLPAGAQVVGGQAQVQTQGRVMTVQQGTDKLALDWQSFNVGQGHTVNFVQPNAQAVALNRVLGSDVSLIQGALNANGKLFLVNPNGILFTPTARVDVGSLVASTLNISPADFMSGKYQFEGDSSNAVENQGQIRAAAGGTVALIAARIVNTGDIQAPAGDIALGAGRKVRLDLGGAVKLDVQEGTLNAMIEQGGALKAADGRVYLSARSARDLVSSVINQTGLIEANSLSGTGGLVALEADQIALGAASKIDATGAQGGGTVLVGGDWQGSGTLRQASQVSMAAGALIDASATQRGDGGKVVLWSDIHRADSVTDVRGTVLAQGGTQGGNGGQVETSGHLLKVDGSVVRAGAEKGVGGVWLLDPYNVTISSSATSNVTPSSSGGTTTHSPSNDNSNIDVTTITAALNSGTSVTIHTGASGTQVGDITVNSAITSTSATDVRLRLQAANSIVVNQDMAATGSGKLNVELDADNDNGVRNGGGIVILGANVSTNGGFLTVGGVASSGFNGGDLFVDGGANAITVNTSGGAVDIKGQLMVASSHASGFSINTGGGNVNVGGSIDSGNTYSLVNQSVNWLDAAQAAKNGTNGGAAVADSYLISVTSRLENSIGVYKANGSGAWIGAYRDPNSSSWFWVGGPEAGGTYAVNGATPITPVSGANGTSFFTQATGLTATGKYENFRKNENGSYAEPNGTGPNGENAGQFVGALGLWNDLVRTDASVHAPGYVRETNAAPSTVNINAGAGSVSMGGSVGASKEIGQLNITAAGLTAGNIKTSTGFSLVNSGAVNLGSTISGTGTLNKSGAGTLTLSGTNTYSGVTTVGQGVLQIGAGGTTGTLGTGAVTNNSTLTFNRSNVAVAGNVISGTGNLVKEGAGTLTLSGNNGYSGETTVNQGTLQIGAGGTTGTLGTGAVTNNGTLTFDRSDEIVVVNTISGTGNLVKNGAGTLSLTGANTFSAGLTLSAGVLGLYHNTAAGSGVVTLANGTTLRLGRTVTQLANDLVLTGNVTVDLDSSLEYLVVGGGGGGGAHAGGGGGGGGVLTGTIDPLTDTNFSIMVGAGGVGAYSVGTIGNDNYTYGSNGESSSISSSSLNTITALGGGRGATYRSAAGGGFNVSSGGGGTGAYAAGTGTVGQGFAGSAGFGVTPYTAGGGGGAGGAAGPASQTNSIDAGARGGAGGIGLASSIAGESNYYGGGGGGSVHGTGFNFTGALGGLGGLGGGGNGSPLTTSVINPVELTASSGVANTGGGGGGGGAALNQIRSYGGAGGSGIVMVRYLGSSAGAGGTVTSGTGTATGYTLHSFTSVGSSNLTLNANALAPVLSGVISGTGSLTVDAAGGSIALTGANTYVNTTISGGILKVGNNTSTGRLGSGTVTNNAALVIDRSNDFAMGNAISGTGSLTKLRATVTTLTGDNSYSGTTTISEGTLQVGDGGTSGSLGTGAVTNSGTLKFNRSNAAVAGNVISGTGDLVKEGAGTLTLTANSTYTGTNTINAGTLVLQNNAPNPSNKAFVGTGAMRIEPTADSFTSAFSTAGWNFASTLTGLTLGKAGNTSGVTIGSNITVAGPISIYGGDVVVNNALSSTLSGAKVLVQSTGHITTAANTSITTNGGDLVLWSDSDASTAGGIQINKGVTLDTRTDVDRTASTHTTGGGRIVLAGGLDDGGTASGIQGQTAGDGRPDGYAVNMTNSNGAVTGVLLGDRAATNNQDSNVSLLSGGGNISVFGAASSSSGNLLTIGVQAHQGYTLDAGTTGSILLAGSGQGSGTFVNWALGYDLAAWRTVGNQSAPSLMRTVNGNIAIVGFAGNTANANNTIGIAIDADVADRVTLAATGTGSVYLQGTAAPGAQAMRLGGIDVLAASGNVSLVAPSGHIHFKNQSDSPPSYLGAKANSVVTTSTSNILVKADALLVDSDMALNVATSGTLTVEPYATSFTSALSTANWTLPSTLSALTLGNASNASDVVIGSNININGPITTYSGDFSTVNGSRMTVSSNNHNISFLASGRMDLDYMTVNAGSGNTLLTASTFNWNTAAAANMPIFNGTGGFTLAPSAASFGQDFTTQWMRFNASDASYTMNGASFSSFTLGKQGNTSLIALEAPVHGAPAGMTVAGPVNLYGGNLRIDTPLTATGSTVSLMGSGSVTDGTTGAIVADRLAVLGGNVTLDSSNNQVGTLAASGVSGLTYVNSDALTIGTVNPVGITATGPVSVSTRSGDLTLGASISTTNTSASAITLNAGSTAAAGSAAGGNIVVTGTPSLSTGSGGRATLYTGGVSGSSSLLGLTGLASGSGRFRYNSDESTSRFTTALGAGLYAVYREQPMVGLSGGNQSIIYGEAAPTMNSAAVNGDAGNVGVQGNVLSGAGKLRVGTYAVGSADLTALGYGGGGTLEVTRKAATISGITAASKVYDANAVATVNTAAASGWIVGDNVVVQTTGTFDSKHVGNAKVVTLGNTSYIGADASNYDFTAQASTTANVTPKAISIRGITAASKQYDAGVGATVSTSAASGWISGDAFSVSATGAFDSKNIGTGKTVTLTSTYAGADVGNYTITPQANTSANVTAKPITIGGITAVDKVYDGSTAASVLVSGATGWISGDDVSLQVTGQFDDKNVRTGKTVTLTSTLSGADVGNYAITSQANTTASVTARTLTAAVVNVPTKTYDGNTTAALTQANFQLSNVVAGEGFAVTQTSGSYNSKDVVAANSVTSNLSTNQFAPATGTLASNYVLPAVATGAGQITPRVVGAMVVNTPTKTYDGNTAAVLNNANFQLSNVVNGEAFAVTQTSGTFNSQDVLTANTVTSQLNANHFTPSQGAVASNYVLPTVTNGAGVITARPLTITADDQKKITGEVDPALTYVLQNLVQGDALQGQVVRAVGESVGEYAIDASGLRNSNYQVTYVNGALTVTPLVQAAGPLTSLMPNPLSLTSSLPPVQNLFSYQNAQLTQFGGMVLIPVKAEQLVTAVGGTARSSDAAVIDMVQSARSMGFSGMLVVNGGVSIPAQAQ